MRFGIAGLALALVVGLGAPALSRALPVGIEAVTFAVASLLLVSLGVVLGREVEALERRTLEDPVTRVGNRRHWEERLACELERAVRSSMPLSVLVLDVDHLKHLNDAHGHACGDRAITLVGEVLRETCRSRDVPARFGGDEFAVVLPRTRSGEARVVAERIRAEIAQRRVELGGALEQMTVSIGVADLEGAAEPTQKALFDAADAALYAAKNGGRDRIEVALKRCTSGVISLDAHRVKRTGRASA